MVKIYYFLAGVITICFGISVILRPRFYDSIHGFYLDFTGAEWIFGGLLITIGILFIFTVIKKQNRKGHKGQP